MKYLALDVGNVLVNVNFKSFVDKISKQVNLPLEEAEYFMSRSHSLHDIGMTTMEHQLREHFSIKSPVIIKELLESWNDVIHPNNQVIDAVLDLVNTHDVKTAIVSNVGLEHSIRMAKILDYGNLFEKSVRHLSCHVGARKPTKLYYQSFLSQYPEFTNCVYVDDLIENLNVAESFGFRTFHFALSEMYDYQIAAKLESLKNFVLEAI